MGITKCGILINGPQGVGKTTVAYRIARRFKRGVHIEADVVKRFVKGGYVGPGMGNLDEFFRQKLLAVENVSCMMRNYLDYGFSVVVSDLIQTEDVLHKYEECFSGDKFYKVYLTADIENLVKRDSERKDDKKRGRGDIEAVMGYLEKLDFSDWVKIDTSDMSVEEVAERVLNEIKK